jgi:hypothetical protein
VLILDEEGTVWGMQHRMRMLAAEDNLIVDLPIACAIGHCARLDAPEGAAHIESLIAQHRPELVIFDSLTRFHGANENDAGEMADVFAVAKRLMRVYDVAMLFSDHLRKKSLINDPEETLPSSTEKRAWPETNLVVAPGEHGHLTVSHIKSRYHDPVPPFSVALAFDEGSGTASLRYAGPMAAAPAKRVNEVLTAFEKIEQRTGDPDTGTAQAVAAWLECSTDSAQRRANKLDAAGLLDVRDGRSGKSGGRPPKVYFFPDRRDR